MLDVLQEIAERKGFITSEHEEEAKSIIELWNAQVPRAEKAGVSHKEMNNIWNDVKWGEYL